GVGLRGYSGRDGVAGGVEDRDVLARQVGHVNTVASRIGHHTRGPRAHRHDAATVPLAVSNTSTVPCGSWLTVTYSRSPVGLTARLTGRLLTGKLPLTAFVAVSIAVMAREKSGPT